MTYTVTMTDIDSDSGTISVCNMGGLEEGNKGQGQGASDHCVKPAHHHHASGQQHRPHLHPGACFAKKTMIKDMGKREM